MKKETAEIKKQNEIKQLNYDETISNLTYLPMMTLITKGVFDASKIQDPYSFHLILMFNVLAYLKNEIYKIRDTDFITNSNYNSSPFNKMMKKIIGKLRPIIFACNLITLTISGYNNFSKQFIEYKIEKENPFTDQNIELPKYDIEHVDAIGIIIDGAEENILLTDEEVKNAKKLYHCFIENPYLDYEQVYQNLATINVVERKSELKEETGVAADYNRSGNIVTVYNNNEKDIVLPHEYIHATGSLKHRFLNEGFTSILIAEYLEDGEITNAYAPEIYLTEIIIELTSKELVLQAFSESNENLIIERLQENSTCQNGRLFLDNMQNYLYACEKLYSGTIEVDKFLDEFTTVSTQIKNYLTEEKIDEDRQIYILQLLYQTIGNEITRIPKYNYNQSKDQSYPILSSWMLEGSCLENEPELDEDSYSKQLH